MEVAGEAPELLRTPTRSELEAGLGNDSVELAELEARVQEKRVAAEVAGDAQRPRLDIEGFVESRGVGTELGAAFERAGQANWITAHVGLTFEAPLDDTRRRAEKTGALLAVSSAEAALRDARARVAAGAALGAANEAAARRSLELAQKTLEITRQSQKAEEERYRLGMSIAVSVQQAGDDVRRAELREARAKVNLVEEQTRLLHYAGKLLEQYHL
jgi:outer membrane protein TolC